MQRVGERKNKLLTVSLQLQKLPSLLVVNKWNWFRSRHYVSFLFRVSFLFSDSAIASICSQKMIPLHSWIKIVLKSRCSVFQCRLK